MLKLLFYVLCEVLEGMRVCYSLSIEEIVRISSYNRITIPVYKKIAPKAGRVVSPRYF